MMPQIISDFEWYQANYNDVLCEVISTVTIDVIIFEKWLLTFFQPNTHNFDTKLIPIIELAGTQIPIEAVVTLFQYYLSQCPTHYFETLHSDLVSPIQLTKAKIIQFFSPFLVSSLSTAVSKATVCISTLNSNRNDAPANISDDSNTIPPLESLPFLSPSAPYVSYLTFLIKSPNPIHLDLYTTTLANYHIPQTLGDALYSLLLTTLQYSQPPNHTLSAYMDKLQFTATPQSASPNKTDPDQGPGSQDFEYLSATRFTAALSLQLLVIIIKYLIPYSFFELVLTPSIFTHLAISSSTIPILTTAQYQAQQANRTRLGLTSPFTPPPSTLYSTATNTHNASFYALIRSILVPIFYTILIYFPSHSLNYIYREIPSLQSHNDHNISFEYRYSSHRNSFSKDSFDDQMWSSRELAQLSIEVLYLVYFSLWSTFSPQKLASQSVLKLLFNNNLNNYNPNGEQFEPSRIESDNDNVPIELDKLGRVLVFNFFQIIPDNIEPDETNPIIQPFNYNDVNTFLAFIFTHFFSPLFSSIYSPTAPISTTQLLKQSNPPQINQNTQNQSDQSHKNHPTVEDFSFSKLINNEPYFSQLEKITTNYFDQNINVDNVQFQIPNFPSLLHISQNKTFLKLYPIIQLLLPDCLTISHLSSPQTPIKSAQSSFNNLNTLFTTDPAFISMRYLISTALRTIFDITNPFLFMQISSMLTLTPSSWLYSQFRDVVLPISPTIDKSDTYAVLDKFFSKNDNNNTKTIHITPPSSSLYPFLSPSQSQQDQLRHEQELKSKRIKIEALFTPNPHQFGSLELLFLPNPFSTTEILQNSTTLSPHKIKQYQSQYGLSVLDYKTYDRLYQDVDPRMKAAIDKIKQQEQERYSQYGIPSPFSFGQSTNMSTNEDAFNTFQRNTQLGNIGDRFQTSMSGSSMLNLNQNLNVYHPDDIKSGSNTTLSPLQNPDGTRNYGSNPLEVKNPSSTTNINTLIGIKLFPTLTSLFSVLMSHCIDLFFLSGYQHTLTIRVHDYDVIDDFTSLFQVDDQNDQKKLPSIPFSSLSTLLNTPSHSTTSFSHITLTPQSLTTLQTIRIGLLIQPLLIYLKTAEFSLFRVTGLTILHSMLKFIKFNTILSQQYSSLLTFEASKNQTCTIKPSSNSSEPPSSPDSSNISCSPDTSLLVKSADIGIIQFNQADFISTSIWEFYFLQPLRNQYTNMYNQHQIDQFFALTNSPNFDHQHGSKLSFPTFAKFSPLSAIIQILQSNTFINLSCSPRKDVIPIDIGLLNQPSHFNLLIIDPKNNSSQSNRQSSQQNITKVSNTSFSHQNKSNPNPLRLTVVNKTSLPFVFDHLRFGQLVFSTVMPLVTLRTQALSHFYAIFAMMDSYTLLFDTHSKDFMIEPITKIQIKSVRTEPQSTPPLVESSNVLTTPINTHIVPIVPTKPWILSNMQEVDQIFISTPQETSFFNLSSHIITFLLDQYKYIPTMDSEKGEDENHLLGGQDLVYKIHPECGQMTKLFYYVPNIIKKSMLMELLEILIIQDDNNHLDDQNNRDSSDNDKKLDDIDCKTDLISPELSTILAQINSFIDKPTPNSTSLGKYFIMTAFTSVQEEIYSTIFRNDFSLFSSVPSQLVFNEIIQYFHRSAENNTIKDESIPGHHEEKSIPPNSTTQISSLDSNLLYYPLNATAYHITLQTLFAHIYFARIISPTTLAQHFYTLLQPLFQFSGMSEEDHQYKHRISIKSLALDGIETILTRLMGVKPSPRFNSQNYPRNNPQNNPNLSQFRQALNNSTNTNVSIPHPLLSHRSFELIEALLLISIEHGTAYHPFFSLTSWFALQLQTQNNNNPRINNSEPQSYDLEFQNKTNIFTLFSTLLHGKQGKPLTFKNDIDKNWFTKGSDGTTMIGPKRTPQNSTMGNNRTKTAQTYSDSFNLHRYADVNAIINDPTGDEFKEADSIISKFLQQTEPKNEYEQYFQSVLFSTNTTPTILLSTVAVTNYKLHGWNGEGLAFDVDYINKLVQSGVEIDDIVTDILDTDLRGDAIIDVNDGNDWGDDSGEHKPVKDELIVEEKPNPTKTTLELSNNSYLEMSTSPVKAQSSLPHPSSSKSFFIEELDDDGEVIDLLGPKKRFDSGNNSGGSNSLTRQQTQQPQKVDHFSSQSPFVIDVDNELDQSFTPQQRSTLTSLLSLNNDSNKSETKPTPKKGMIFEVTDDIEFAPTLPPPTTTVNRPKQTNKFIIEEVDDEPIAIVTPDTTKLSQEKLGYLYKNHVKELNNNIDDINKDKNNKDNKSANLEKQSALFQRLDHLDAFQNIPLSEYTLQKPYTGIQSTGMNYKHGMGNNNDAQQQDQQNNIQWRLSEDLLLSEFSYLFLRYTHLLSLVFSSTIRWCRHPIFNPPTQLVSPLTTRRPVLIPSWLQQTQNLRFFVPIGPHLTLLQSFSTKNWSFDPFEGNNNKHNLLPKLLIQVHTKTVIKDDHDDDDDDDDRDNNINNENAKMLSSHQDKKIQVTNETKIYSIDSFITTLMDPKTAPILEPFSQRRSSKLKKVRIITNSCEFIIALTVPQYVVQQQLIENNTQSKPVRDLILPPSMTTKSTIVPIQSVPFIVGDLIPVISDMSDIAFALFVELGMY